MYLSIVVTTYKRTVCLERCLQSLIMQDAVDIDFSYEIIVAIDNRDRETVAWIKEKKEFKHIQYVLSEGHGANAVRNKGIQSSKGDIIFFLDDDCVAPERDWFKKVVLSFREYSDADVIGGGYICDHASNILVRSRCLLDNYYVKREQCSGSEVVGLLGGNCGYKKETFGTYGLFDVRIAYGWAETELHMRIKGNGGKLIYQESISVYHMPETRSVVEHFIRSFKQGVGCSYSFNKNKRICLTKRKTSRFWFIAITQEYRGNVIEKCMIGLVLFCVAGFYYIGKLWGSIKYML